MAELADALDSKSSTRESVWVRPPPSAPPFFIEEHRRPSSEKRFHLDLPLSGFTCLESTTYGVATFGHQISHIRTRGAISEKGGRKKHAMFSMGLSLATF